MDVLGLGVSLIFFLIACIITPESYHLEYSDPEDESPLKKDFDFQKNLNLVLKDYETYNNEVERRENITLVIGTLLIGASFLLFGEATKKSDVNGSFFLITASSLGLYVIWLRILHYSTRVLDRYAYRRMGIIEQRIEEEYEYDFGVHSYLINKRIWYRSLFWYILLFFMIGIWIFLSLIKN